MHFFSNELLLREYANDIIFYIAINFWYIFFIAAVIFFLLSIKFLKDYINLKFQIKKVNTQLLQPLTHMQRSEDFKKLLRQLDALFSLQESALYVKQGEIYVLDIRSQDRDDIKLEQRLYQRDLVEHAKIENYTRYIFFTDDAALVLYASKEIDLEMYREVLQVIVAFYEKVVKKNHGQALMVAERRSQEIVQKLFNIRSTTEAFLQFVVSLLRKKTGAQKIVVYNQSSKKEKVFPFGDQISYSKRFFIRNTPYIVDIYTSQPLEKHDIDKIGKFLDYAGGYYENLDTDSKMVRNYIEFLRFSVQALELQSSYFQNHAKKVQLVSIEIGKNLFLDEENLHLIALGAEFHDVGMIGKIESLLDKQEVEEKELDLIKYHPIVGAILVEPINAAYPIADIIRYHHERYDGSGYPYGVKGSNFPLAAQIVALAEFYVGITSPRAYRQPLSHDQAIRKIREQKNRLVHEKVIEAFLENHTNIKKKLELIEMKESSV